MNRYVLTAAVALLILWQSNCLEFRDGAIINRCGLWQLFTGDLMLLSVGKPPKLAAPREIIRETIHELAEPVLIYRDRPPATMTPMTLSPGGVYSTGTTFQSCDSYGSVTAYAVTSMVLQSTSTTGSTVICMH
jgi:hypothetical protein